MLSLFVFIFYLNGLIKLSETNDCKGLFINENPHNIPMVFFANDIVLVSEQLEMSKNCLTRSEFCDKWQLKVNMEETKCMVFQNGGIN